MTPIELHLNVKPERLWKRWLHTEKVDLGYDQKNVFARENISRKAAKRRARFNQERKFKYFEVGNRVLLKANNVSDFENGNIAKVFSVYEGPYIIKKIYGKTTNL